MSEIVYYDEEVTDTEAQISKGLENLHDLKGPERAEQLSRLDTQMKRLKKSLANFKVELKGVRDTDQRTVYDGKFKEHEALVRELEGELRDAVKGPVVQAEKQESQVHNMLDQGIDLQQQSLAALKRTEREGHATQQIAEATNLQLRQQTEKIAEIGLQMNTLTGQLKRAQKDVMWFVRNAGTDKCFMVIFCLVVLGIIFVICWQTFLHKYIDKIKADPGSIFKWGSNGTKTNSTNNGTLTNGTNSTGRMFF